ncbi:MAG: thiol reductant ABC exporter subunit CydC [Gammaproteobacteria bacterium]|nr:thiol reductant ABC exporter subunit CydC [Gammaproteobacteria bacterium]
MNGRADLWRLLGILRRDRMRMLGGVGLALMAGLAAAGLMAVSGWFIAAMAMAGAAGTAINYFTPAALIRLLAILRSGGRYGERLATHDATLRGLAHLRAWLLRRLIPLAPARLVALRSAELFARLRTDVDSLEQWYLMVLVPLLVAVAGFCLVAGVLAWLLPVALWVVVPAMAATAGLVPAAIRRATRADARAGLAEATQLRGLFVDAVRGHAELVAWGQVDRHAHAIAALDATLVARRARTARWEAIGASLPGFVAQLAIGGVVACALIGTARPLLAPALLVMLVFLVLSGHELIAPLPEAVVAGQAARMAAERVFALADTPPAVTEPAQPVRLERAASVRFTGVRFRYEPAGAWVLDGLDLDIPEGARVAIVGPSGAGKTSLIRVLQKFYPIEEGTITLGGQPLQTLAGADVRHHISVIPERPTLLNRSLRDNLRLGAPGALDGDIDRAVEAAQLKGFVAGLPDGYETFLGEGGTRVSGGEARRIVIARAILQDAPILVLDEPTEGLDTRSVCELFGALETVARGRTVLLVTHRLVGLTHLIDEVVVMEAGSVRARMPLASYVSGACRVL